MNVPLGTFTEKNTHRDAYGQDCPCGERFPDDYEHYGASPAKVVFATIGAISAVGPTFTTSLLTCLTQIC